ncbi:MAG: type I-U CRISPR-associated protein Csx17 [Hyphomicrobiales bacterium]|nr:type I-U CRISPR-associated protein Csx17 [Hyphomicrobiales bacterium]
MPEIVLAGCAPIPLASYLKALGIFRLVAEQKDKTARGCWRDETFVLDTALTNEDLVRFFLDEYRPSPIISPWNGGSGFYFREGQSGERDPATGKKIKTGVRDEPTAATRIVSSFAATKSKDRLALYGAVISQTQSALSALGRDKAPADDRKRGLVMQLRARLPEECLAWLDAAIALAGETLGFPPLLGSGGNDGNLDFSSNFMLRLADVIDPETGISKASARAPLEAALFGGAAAVVGKGAIGQFAPGAAGGPNAAAGFERGTLINSWDYILMLEGAVMFAASATRRLGASADPGSLSYPFTVRTASAAGAGTALSDEGDARGEVWLPLWNRSASLAEIRSLLSEGRATLGRRAAQDGLDFARAVATLGVNRGVAAFQRFGLLQRSGKAYVAAPMSRVRVQHNPRADLLNDLDRGAWLPSFRRFARSANAPARLRSLALRLDEAIFAMTRETSPRAVQRVLVAVGEAASYLASSPKAPDAKEGGQEPPPRLSQAWFEAANDGSAEFRIAAALAGLGRAQRTEDHVANAGDETDLAAVSENDIVEAVEGEAGADVAERHMSDEEGRGPTPPPPLRAHLAPLKEETWYKRFRAWRDRDGLAVWGAGALERNLIAIAERRLVFAAQRKLDGGPFDGRAPADLSSVLSFLWRETDDEKIAGVAQGLAWAEAPSVISMQAVQARPLPLAYALMKPFFAPIGDVRVIDGVPNDIRLPVPSGLTGRLRTGDIGAAMALACRRARASGLPITFEPRREDAAGIDGPRLLAALLMPICKADLRRVLERAYPRLFESKGTSQSKEDAANAA